MGQEKTKPITDQTDKLGADDRSPREDPLLMNSIDDNATRESVVKRTHAENKHGAEEKEVEQINKAAK